MYITIFLSVTLIINGIIFIDGMNVNAIKPTISTIGITKNETNTIILYAAQVEEKYNWADIMDLRIHR